MSPANPAMSQPPLWDTPQPAKPPHKRTRRHLRPIPNNPPTVRHTPPTLTPEQATQDAHTALTTAGLRHQISRIVTWPTNNNPGCLTTVALLRHGANPQQIHTTLTALPGVTGSHPGQASISTYRQITT